MKWILIVLALLTQSCHNEDVQTIPMPKSCHGRPTTIAIIDTGFGAGFRGEEMAKLCKYGHKNFVDDDNSFKFGTKDPVPVDHNGHGTHVAGIIDKYAREANINYCLVVIEYYSPKDDSNQNLQNTVKAINYAKQIHVDFINYSSGGLDKSNEEVMAVKNFLNAGGKFIAAAGNEHTDLSQRPYYPAMDDSRVIVVGSIKRDGTIARYSNFGTRVNRWEMGSGVEVFGKYMGGTSQACAIATGKLVGETKNFCK